MMGPSSEDQWRIFLCNCLMRRVDVLDFKDLSRLLLSRYPISETTLLDVLLASQSLTRMKWDPLLPLYIDCLRKIGKLRAATVLESLLKHSFVLDNKDCGGDDGDPNKFHKKSMPARDRSGFCTFMTDIKVMQDIILSISTGHIPKTSSEAVSIFSVVAEWILAVVAWHNRIADGNQQADSLNSSPDAISLFESLGILLAALSGSAKGSEALSAGRHDSLKIKLGQALSAYSPLCVGLSLPLRNRLDTLQREFHLYGEPPARSLEDTMMDGVNVNALQFEDSVMDEPVINSRAGLYVYLNAMLVGRPLVDDNMLINYLNNKYGGQYGILVEEIITAAFDVLSNAMYRNESNRTMFLLRSFLVNKLPAFFAALSAASMIPIPMELCISHALNRLDPNTFPSFSQMFAMEGNTVLSDVRQEFLFSCASHRLIPESSIERLLGENPMQTLPVGGPYSKDDLVSQINVSPARAEQVINDIESMDGNTGAIVGAITEVMHQLCYQKETVTLKYICNLLSRRLHVLDVILLFRSPKQVLQPLCTLLDTWHWDEDDQGENQPVYDEFGSILLLVLAFKYRYDLGPCDLGVTSKDSFILKLLERGCYSQNLGNLTEKQNKNLGAWIGALFIAEGISEETMSACSPQEFYLLVSTLFSQSLGACEIGKLEFETLKGGFEYLLEPFLLPSLVIALTWLGNHIWELEGDPAVSLKTMHSLVEPNSISGEADAIHQTVLSITGRTLEEQLKDVRNRHPTRTDIKPILDALEPYYSFHQVGNCHHSELEIWTNHTGGGGFLGSIRNTFQSLVLWSANPEMNMSPHSYTHRQILAGIRVFGSARVLSALIDELKLQSETGSGALALDVAATLVCSPLAESFALDQHIHHCQHRQQGQQQERQLESNTVTTKEPTPHCSILTLRDALNLQHENVSKISEQDPLGAQAIVRLFRRVNALLAPPSHQTPVLDMDNNNNVNIIRDMQLGGQADTHMPPADRHPSHFDRPGMAVNVGLGVDVGMDVNMTGHDDDPEDIGRMFDNAAAGMGNMTNTSDANAQQRTGNNNMGLGGGVGGNGNVEPGTETRGEAGAEGENEGMTGFDTNIDDVLNAADMKVENPELLDLDMGMF